MESSQVAANANFGLYYGLAAQDDVRGAMDLRTTGDFVAGVLATWLR